MVPFPFLQYSDGSYLATVIACLGYSLVLTTSAELQGQTVDTSQEERKFNDEILVQSVEELDRYMEMDRLVPSYQNVVTIAGLECRIKLTLAYLIPLDIRRFLSYTRCVSSETRAVLS
jgi:transcription initiation factor TFIID subunit 2